MTIDDMHVYRFDIPLKDVFTIATMSLSTAENLLVEIRTDQGLTGWGRRRHFGLSSARRRASTSPLPGN